MFKPQNAQILIVAGANPGTLAIKTTLRDAGYAVSVVNAPKQARTALRKQPPDLIIIGSALAASEQESLWRTARQEPALLVPCLIILDQNSGDRELELLEAGIDDCLVEPFTPAQLLARTRVLLNFKRLYDRQITLNRQLQTQMAAQAQINTSQAGRELELLKAAIVRNVSHELRTPVLQVKSAVALLNEYAPPGDPTDRLMSMAVQAIGRMESTVTSISQFAESQNLHSEVFPVVESVEMAMRNLDRRWTPTDTARIERACTINPLVLSDRRGVAQVLMHLLDNALKFSPDGGRVEVLIETREKDRVWIAVRDHGIGIPANQLALIFDAFYQVDASLTRQFGGVGVGLALAKLMLNQMGTTITVSSKPGKGSTFSFTLPLVEIT